MNDFVIIRTTEVERIVIRATAIGVKGDKGDPGIAYVSIDGGAPDSNFIPRAIDGGGP
jgi:hypothetical protein